MTGWLALCRVAGEIRGRRLPHAPHALPPPPGPGGLGAVWVFLTSTPPPAASLPSGTRSLSALHVTSQVGGPHVGVNNAPSRKVQSPARSRSH